MGMKCGLEFHRSGRNAVRRLAILIEERQQIGGQGVVRDFRTGIACRGNGKGQQAAIDRIATCAAAEREKFDAHDLLKRESAPEMLMGA